MAAAALPGVMVRRRTAVPAACAGMVAGMAAILVSVMQTKTAVAAGLGFCGLCVWPCIGRRGRGIGLIALFVFGISLKLNKTFFLYEFSQWQYVPFAGGAAGLTIGLIDIAALALLAGALRRQPGSQGARPDFVWALLSGPLLFMLAGVASLRNAPDPALVGFELCRQSLLLLSMAAAMTLSADQMRLTLRLLGLSIVVQGAIACLQVALKHDLGLAVLGEQPLVEEQIGYAYEARAVGTIGHSNVLSYFFEITLPLMLALLLTPDARRDRLVWLAAIGAGLAGVLVTLSRAAWIAVPLTMIPVFLLYRGRSLLRLRGAVALVGGAILGAAALVAAWSTIAHRIFSDDAGSTDARGPLNEAALSVIGQFPIFGVGLNNLGNALPMFDTTHNARVLGPVNHVVHNLYLLVLSEVGVIGFLAFLWCFAAALGLGWRLRRSPDPWARAIGVGGAAGLLAHLIHGTFDPGYKISLPVSSLIAVQTGLIGLAWVRHRRAVRALPTAVTAPRKMAPRAIADVWPEVGGRLTPRRLPSARAYR